MIIRITAKLGKKIGEAPSVVLPLDENPYADWSAHLFYVFRTQYILITNTLLLYSMVVFGKGIISDSRFLDHLTHSLSDFIRSDGFESIYEKFIIPAWERVFFSKTLNRSVTGSMNDLTNLAKFHLVKYSISPYDLSFKLNETPMKSLGYISPKEAFKAVGGQLGIDTLRFV